MPPAYVIVNNEVTDPQTYERYRSQVLPTVQKYGGTFTVRGGRFQKLEGAEPMARHVMLKFPSFERALEWYNSPEYQPLAKLRQSASKGNIVLVEGVD
jgi:uncharacterized protein (DUF1330 family)